MTKHECQQETLKHINIVRKYMNDLIKKLEKRALSHDQSKLQSPEVEIFAEYTPKLATTTYGSDEYMQNLKEMQVALDHHYAISPHHPEYSDYIKKEWFPLKDYEDYYEISDYGDVRDMQTKATIERFNTPEGYHKVYLCRNGEKEVALVHMLAALQFVPRIRGRSRLKHKDFNKSNNHISNLEWDNTALPDDYDRENIYIQCIEENIMTLGISSMANEISKIDKYYMKPLDEDEICHELNGHSRTIHDLSFILLFDTSKHEVSQSKLAKMTLIDLIEMICDWKAATLRHKDGNIYKSVEDNQKRFGYSDEIKQILINTVKLIEDIERDMI